MTIRDERRVLIHGSPDNFSGPDPLWRDVLNSHQTRPFHVMIGGGDQIYNDAVMTQSPLFREWLEIKNPHHKYDADFSPSMREELETFYLERYSMWFSQGLFGMANSQIPMVNMWDDHGKSFRTFQRSDFCPSGRNLLFRQSLTAIMLVKYVHALTHNL